MRFLCLHGRGTNAAIFKDQTAKIREVIGQDNEFVFINGCVATNDVPGIGAVMEGDRYGFVPLHAEADVYREFFLEMQHFIRSQGPFDGLMGFSEGASIVMTMMVEDAIRPFAEFKCAILFCALVAIDPAPLRSRPSLLRFLDPNSDRALIQVPTAHIWSKNDTVANGSSRDMVEVCDESTREVSIHSLGHDIPGSRSDESLAAALRVIERTIENGKAFVNS